MKNIPFNSIIFLVLLVTTSCEEDEALPCTQATDCQVLQKCSYPSLSCVTTCLTNEQCRTDEICADSRQTPGKHCQETPTCAELETKYSDEADNYSLSCSVDNDCRWIDGHCGDGLGGCFYAAGKDVVSTLNEIKAAYSEKSCSIGALCSCFGKTAFHCVDNVCINDPFE